MLVHCFMKLVIYQYAILHLMCIPLHCVCLGPSQIHYSCVEGNGMPTDNLIQIVSAHKLMNTH